MEQKYIPLNKNSKISQNSLGGTWNTKTQSKGYSVNFIKKATPTQKLLHKFFPLNFEKNINTAFNTYCLC